MKNKASKTLVMSFVILISFIAVMGIIGWFILSPSETILQGEVEANEVRVSGKLAGRILELKVKEGESVEKGQLLVVIDLPEISAKALQAKSLQDAAQAVSNKANKGTREETIEAAKEQYERAKAAADYASKTYKRMKNSTKMELLQHRNSMK